MNWKTHAFAILVAVCLLGSLTGCATQPADTSAVDWGSCRPFGQHIIVGADGNPTFNYLCGNRTVAVTVTANQYK